ncbi:Uma2 family endonuclease [Kitasatospora purpeofusca]|uniref:Uma2 family endonuclease n=1 Tax=Kitasatospora purpeofusca TaxID=67352 RepID=UPI003699C0F1
MSVDPMDYARLREIAGLLSPVPGIGKIEIADGAIVLTLPPVDRHESAVAHIARQLNTQLPRTHPGRIARAGADLEDAARGRRRTPDLVVCAEAASESAGPALLPHEVLLVVEVVSAADPKTDHHDKVRDYAAMGIPLYLLVDPRKGTGIVHDEPGCTSRKEFAFGDTITVGPWTLDTGVLRTYA